MAAPPTRRPPAPARVLVVTADLELLDEVLRLTAVSGVEVDVAHEASLARSRWTSASLVLVGAQAAGALAAQGLPRRDGVVVVAGEASGDLPWRAATELGAETVVVLPEAQPWLVGRLGDAAHGDGSRALVLATMSGRGGAGASTLAAALALRAQASGWPTMLIDGDAGGGGIDLLLGAEEAAGLRWSQLRSVRGRVDPESLRQALPRIGRLHLLSCDLAGAAELDPEALRAVLHAAARTEDVVVVDLPRSDDGATREALRAVDHLLLVVPAEVRAVAAARGTVARLVGLGVDVRAVVRGPLPSGVDAEMVAEGVGAPLMCSLRPEAGVVAAAERGEVPALGRGSLARAARAILEATLPERAAA